MDCAASSYRSSPYEVGKRVSSNDETIETEFASPRGTATCAQAHQVTTLARTRPFSRVVRLSSEGGRSQTEKYARNDHGTGVHHL